MPLSAGVVTVGADVSTGAAPGVGERCNRRVTLVGVPTAHPRIALTRDPELDEALRRTRPLLGERKATSALARELILRGARDLLADQGPELDRWLDERHATAAPRSTQEVLASARRLGAPDAAKPYAASEALNEVRGERL